MAGSTIINTAWKVGELRAVADEIRAATQDRDQRQVVTMTIVGDTVSTATKPTITLVINGASTVLQG